MNRKSDSTLTEKEQPGQPASDQTRPLRIVMVNDERCVLESLDVMIRFWLKDVTVLMFDNAADALVELSRTDPELLITDDKMANMDGKELCHRLLGRKVRYPVVVVSPWAPTEEWVREFATRGLNVSFLVQPFDFSTFRDAVAASLNIPPDKSHE